jgi:dTDP-4-dehydrorhamnose 3,5-epimerase
MQIIPTEIPAVKVIVPKRIGDNRGFFSEVYSRRTLTDAGINADFIQDNHSLSAEKGVVRGMHWQLPPAAQDKLVRVVRGAILDVAVDIRRASPTFGRHVAVLLSAENWNQIFIPVGFAHGFVTLEPNTEVLYKVTAPYAPQQERGFRWNDPDVGIEWGGGVTEATATLSPKDKAYPSLKDVQDLF